MLELREPAAPVVYQVRVVLRGVSPLIWRRLLVRSDSTVADLHATVQIALGWSGGHRHCFVIQGRQYGHDGYIDPRGVRPAALGLRIRGVDSCGRPLRQRDVRGRGSLNPGGMGARWLLSAV